MYYYFSTLNLISLNIATLSDATPSGIMLRVANLGDALPCRVTLPDDVTLDPNRDCEALGIDPETGESVKKGK